MDRHFLSLIESKVCIGSVDESLYPSPGATTTIETLRLILAQKFDNTLNFRELPVSLLRLYFSGQQRLTRFITRLTQSHFNSLVIIMMQDGVTLQPLQPSQMNDPYTEPLYIQKCIALESYIKTLLDYCLCSFETTLSRVTRALFDDAAPQGWWLQFGLQHALQYNSYWANFPKPRDLNENKQSYCIWLTCVWRMNVTVLLCKLLCPWDDDISRDWVSYQCQLFRDTHLDILTVMTRRNLYDDESVASAQHNILRDFYPLCHRVCCAGELPDFASYATDNFKTGSNLKERSSLDDKIGHIFVGKTGPNICKIRNFYDIVIRYGEEDPIIYDILKNVTKCVLLGNLPHSKGTLNANARRIINDSFFTESADKEIDEAVFRDITKNKSMKRTRSKKKTKDELVYKKTNFKLWLLLRRHLVLYLLKEHNFYIAESTHWFDELLCRDYKYIRYRDIVLVGNGRCRNILSQQAKKLGLKESFDWRVIEFEEKSKETYDTKSGEIKKTHAWSLTVARKVQKDEFKKILAKKMTNTEESIGLSPNYKPFYYIKSKGEKPSPGCTIDIVDLHFLCYLISKLKGEERKNWTSKLKVIGMSQWGLETLRMWYFQNKSYDIPDNSLKKLIKEFHANSTTDYMILKTVLKLIEYYNNDQIFHLPLPYAKKQIYALRGMLGIDDGEPTPPLLGFVYQCSGVTCGKFANAIIEPYNHNNKPRPVPEKLSKLQLQKKRQDEEKQKKHREAHLKKLGSNTKSISRLTKKLEDKSLSKSSANASCYLNMASFNMDDGGLHCSKYTNTFKHALLDTGAGKGQVIMRKKDGSVVVRSNKTVLLSANPLHQESSTTSSPTKVTSKSSSSSSSSKKGQHNNLQPSAKEREDKKTLWLLEVRSFDLGETASGGLADDVSCGLFATTRETDDTDSKSLGATAMAINRVAADLVVPKKNNKKIYLTEVNKAITDMGYTCNARLTCIDFVGIVKNLKVLCCEPRCGQMTEMRNHNQVNHGWTCGRHKGVHDSDYEMDIADVDKRAISAAKKKEKERKNMNECDVIASVDQQDNNSNMGGARFVSLSSSTRCNNVTLKKQLHPLDIIQDKQSAPLEGDHCAYCSVGVPKYRVACLGHHRAIVKVAFCKPCFQVCTSLTGRHPLVSLREIYQYMRQKRPL